MFLKYWSEKEIRYCFNELLPPGFPCNRLRVFWTFHVFDPIENLAFYFPYAVKNYSFVISFSEAVASEASIGRGRLLPSATFKSISSCRELPVWCAFSILYSSQYEIGASTLCLSGRLFSEPFCFVARGYLSSIFSAVVNNPQRSVCYIEYVLILGAAL